VLRLHEALDLRRQSVRVGVVHDPDQNASSTTAPCACASNASCFLGSKVRFASSMMASALGFAYQPQLTPTGATWLEWKKRMMASSGSDVT
jgi:hypothetical protein